MNLIIFLSLTIAASSFVVAGEEQQRILQRIVKSNQAGEVQTGRVRQLTPRSAAGTGEKDVVPAVSPASFGQRSLSESGSAKITPAASSSPTQTQLSSSSTPIPAAINLTSTNNQTPSERQQSTSSEIEVISNAPSSWQVMAAIEPPAAVLVASGARAAGSSDLVSSSSEDSSSSLFAQSDFLRSPSSTKGGSSLVGETFSRLRQQSSGKTRRQEPQQQQQSFFYPQQQQSQGKTSNYQASKTSWYKPTTPRPAPIVQQRYEQQSEQYVEQQQQLDSAPPGQAEPFAFNFDTQDNSGNGQYRKEESDNNGVVRGSYGFRDASGMYRHVDYIADQNGFRANIKSNEPGVEGGPEKQPASIKLDGPLGAAPAQSQRFTNNNDNGDWSPSSAASNERAELAIAPPDFESIHKAERIR
uniref:Cuticle protein 16.8 n=1 Tax=Aceria tosichella TaxID=561515 RepID=A0A6G1S744_9ACAR